MAASMQPRFLEDPCGFLYALARQEPGLNTRVNVGSGSVLVIQEADVAGHILASHPERYGKNFGRLTALFGQSRISLDGTLWRKSQRLSQPHLGSGTFTLMAAAVQKHYGTLADELLAVGETGQSFVIDPYVDRAAVAVILDILFSARLEDMGETFSDDLRVTLRYLARRTWDTAHLPEPNLDSEHIAAQAAYARMRVAVGDLIERRIRSTARQPDLLTDLVEAAQDAEDPIRAADEIIMFIAAGSDTASACLGWAISLLARRPDLQERLRGHVAHILGDRPATSNDVDRLTELRAFLDETMRVLPPVPFVTRVASAPDQYGNITIANQELVLISIIGLHHDPRFWTDPHVFRPERFAGPAPRLHRWSYIPFATGPRACGGMRLAVAELTLALSLVLRRIQFTRSKPSQARPLRFDWQSNLRRLGGQQVCIRRLASEIPE